MILSKLIIILPVKVSRPIFFLFEIFPDSYAELPINNDKKTSMKKTLLSVLCEFDLKISPKPNLEIIPKRALNSCK